MPQQAQYEEREIAIRDPYPHMNEEELAEAEANLKRYVAVIVRIYDRLKAEGKRWHTPEETSRMMEEDGFKATEVDL
jgi:hypothetical protein